MTIPYDLSLILGYGKCFVKNYTKTSTTILYDVFNFIFMKGFRIQALHP